MANEINYIVSRYVILIYSEELIFLQNEKNSKEGLNNISCAERHIRKDKGNLNLQKIFHLYNNYKYRKKNLLSDENLHE